MSNIWWRRFFATVIN